MSILVCNESIGISGGTKFERYAFLGYKLADTGEKDSVDIMEKYGWGLIAPATLSKWQEE